MPFFKSEKNSRVCMILAVLLCSISFLLLNIYPPIAQSINPLICANLAFIFHLAFFYLLRIIGYRNKIYLASFTLVGLIAISNFTSTKGFYEIAYADNTSKLTSAIDYDANKRVSLDQYLEVWLDKRKAYIAEFLRTHDSYPLLFVAAEGGGSMAAYWTSNALSYLQRRDEDFYNNHLFMMSGASGGNTGNSMYLTMKEGEVDERKLTGYVKKIFGKNYLSSGLTRLFGFDSWQSILGLNLTINRTDILESQWDYQIENASGVTTYSEPLLSFYYEPETMLLKKNPPPILLEQSTHVQSGNQFYFSPVTLDLDIDYNADLLSLISEQDGPEKTVKICTANAINASFPFVNSAGYISELGNFVDAGYKDNFGTYRLAQIVNKLKSNRTESIDSIYTKLQFVGVVIQNTGVSGEYPPELDGSNIQTSAPLSAIANSYGSFYFHGKHEFIEACDDHKQIVLTHEKIVVPGKYGRDSTEMKPQIPIARYLSRDVMNAMDESIIKQARDKKSSFNSLIRMIELKN